MANIFEAVREAVPVPVAAERYGLKANHAGMACCPFHDDHTPSLKLNEDYFYCFGCGAGGDVVELTRRLFDLRPYEAANKLAVDFGVDVPATAPPDGSLNRFRSDLLRCQQVLDEYLNLLIRWQRKYAPRSTDDEPDEAAWKHFQNFSEPYKRIRIAYIEAARKRPEEFQKRLNSFVEKTRLNKRIVGYGGIEKYYG
jgi:DNA primase